MGDTVNNLRAELLKALGSPLRLKILEALSDGEKNVCELMEVVGAPQSTVSCHLTVLRTSGVVTDRREGCSVYYRVSDENVYALMKTLDELLKSQCEEVKRALEAL